MRWLQLYLDEALLAALLHSNGESAFIKVNNVGKVLNTSSDQDGRLNTHSKYELALWQVLIYCSKLCHNIDMGGVN